MAQEDIYNYYVLFPNHHEGLRAHKEFKAAGLKCTISPTPREASVSCGISLLVKEEFLKAAREIIEENNIKIEGIVRVAQKKGIWNRTC